MEDPRRGADPADLAPDPESSGEPVEPVLIRAERSTTWAWLLMILVVGAVFAADQFTKASVEQSLLLGEHREVFTWLAVSHMQNTGLILGFLADSDLPLDLFLGAAILMLANILMSRMREPVVWLPTGLILGGAMGNAVSRFRDGYVVDFIWISDVPAVFNVADVAVVAGALVLAAVRLRNAYVAARWRATVQRLAETHGYGERSSERLETVG